MNTGKVGKASSLFKRKRSPQLASKDDSKQGSLQIRPVLDEKYGRDGVDRHETVASEAETKEIKKSRRSDKYSVYDEA